MIRDGETLVALYVHVDIAGLPAQRLKRFRDGLRAKLRQHPSLSKVVEGVNVNFAKTQVVAKVVAPIDPTDWLNSRSWSGRILRIFTEPELPQVRALVSTEEWYPEDADG